MESRSGKQCRERYINQLDPRIKKSMWTFEEDAIIMRLHSQYGKKWSRFMDQLPGRSDNAIKNRYHIISRDNYCDHYQQHSQHSQQKKNNEDDEEDGSDEQSDSSGEDDEALLKSLQAKRKMIDQQIETLVQKRQRLRVVSCDDEGSSADSLHDPVQASNDISGLDSPLKDAAEHLSALRTSAAIYSADSFDSQRGKTAPMQVQEPQPKECAPLRESDPATFIPFVSAVAGVHVGEVVSDAYTLL